MTAKHTERQNQGVRPSRSPAFPFNAVKWIAGTMALTYEEKGFLIDILAALSHRGGPIPFEQVPMAVRCDPRVAKRLVARLIDAGKLSLDAANRVYNDHLNTLQQVTDQTTHDEPVRVDFRSTSGGTSRELPAKVRQKSGKSPPTSFQKSEENQQALARAQSETKTLPFEEGVFTDVNTHVSQPRSLEVFDAFQAWQEMALRLGLPQAPALTPDLRRKIAVRIRENGPGSWQLALANVERSSFCQGNNQTGWRMDLHSLVKPEKFAKAVSGAYGNGAHSKSSATGVSHADHRQGFGTGAARGLTKHDRLKLAIAESNRQLGIGPDPGPEGPSGAVELCGSVLRGSENLWEGT